MPTFLGVLIALTAAAPQASTERLPDLLLESRTAERLATRPGDTVRVSTLAGPGRPFRVAGIYRRPADPSTVTLSDYRAILHLPDLQQLVGAPDRVDRFTLALRNEAEATRVIAEIDRLAFGADAYPTERVATATSETFRVVSRFHRALAGITITGSAVFLLCLVVLKVEERRMESAAMREIGISRRTLFLWTFAETVAMAVIGTAAGLGLGWLGSLVINGYFRRVYDTGLAFARVTPGLAMTVAGIGVTTGVAIGVVAGWRMVRSAPARLREP